MAGSDQKIVCPSCGREFPLSDALAHQIEEKFRKLYDERAKEDRQRVTVEARARAREELAVEMRDLKESADEVRARLRATEAKELEARRRARELEENERALAIEFERKLDGERQRVADEARRTVGEEADLKVAERDKRIGDLLTTIDELRRKAHVGSQQAQGEILELELESQLRARFPDDEIAPVQKGRRGADILQRVKKSGQLCGTIVWETKRTKTWMSEWVTKLKEDRERERADVAALVSTALPRDLRHLGQVDGVWVCDFPTALGLAAALRKSVIDLFLLRQSTSGRAEKKELLYNYLASPEFGQRITGLVETFREMKRELEQERAAYTRIWAKREKQLDQFMEHTARMYGDMEAIFGSGLPEIPGLALPGAEQLPLLGDGDDS
jgi:hypothetical protein